LLLAIVGGPSAALAVATKAPVEATNALDTTAIVRTSQAARRKNARAFP
jgi:hypothetical protein